MAFKVRNNEIILNSSDAVVDSLRLGNTESGAVQSPEILVHDSLGNVTLQNVTIDATNTIDASMLEELQDDLEAMFVHTNHTNVVATYDDPANEIIFNVSDLSNMTKVGFDTTLANPTYAEGTLFYDNTHNALSYYNDAADVTVNIGREVMVRVANNTATPMTNGSVVYLSGVCTVENIPEVTLSQANTIANAQVDGVLIQDIPAGTCGYMTKLGTVRDVSTSLYTAGDKLYLSDTAAGGFTTTPPTWHNYVVEVGRVTIVDAATGEIEVNIVSHAFDDLQVENLAHFEGGLQVDAAIDANSQLINNLATPIAATDAANKSYVDSAISSGTGALTTDDIPEGTTNKYYATTLHNTDFDTRLATKTTSDLTEGTNLYYTTTRANTDIDARVDQAFVNALNVTAAAVQANSVALATDTTGNYVATIAGTASEIDVTGSGSENAAVTLSLPTNMVVPQDLTVTGDLTVNGTTITNDTTTVSVEDPYVTVGGTTAPTSDDNKDRGVRFRWHDGTSAKLGFFGMDDSDNSFFYIPDATETGEVFSGTLGDAKFGTVTASLTGNVTGDLTGNADTATALETGRNFSLTGDVVANAVSFDGTGNVVLNTTIQPNSVALGTDTTGNYMSNVSAGSGISITHTPAEGSTATIAHADTSTVSDLTATSRTYVDGLTFDTFGHITGYTTSSETVVNADNYVDTASMVGGLLTLGRTGTLPDLTVDLDARYYTEAEADVRFVNVTGDSMTGALTLSGNPTATNHAANKAYVDSQVGALSDKYVDTMSFNTGNGVLTLGRTNGLLDLTVDLDGRYSLLGHTHSYDNYGGWTLHTDSTSRGTISSSEVVNFVGGTNVTLGYSATNNTITINSTDTNTDTNNYLTGLTFNTGDGILTATRLGLSNITVDLDGRYSLSTHNHDTAYAALAHNHDAAYVNASGDTMTGTLTIGTIAGSAGTLNVTGNIVATGDVTAYSDRRFKHNIETVTNAVNTVEQLRGVTFEKDNRQSIGVIAQEVEEILPEVVHTSDEGLKSVAYGNMIGLLIEAIKEQQQQINTLTEIVNNLQNKS